MRIKTGLFHKKSDEPWVTLSVSDYGCLCIDFGEGFTGVPPVYINSKQDAERFCDVLRDMVNDYMYEAL